MKNRCCVNILFFLSFHYNLKVGTYCEFHAIHLVEYQLDPIRNKILPLKNIDALFSLLKVTADSTFFFFTTMFVTIEKNVFCILNDCAFWKTTTTTICLIKKMSALQKPSSSQIKVQVSYHFRYSIVFYTLPKEN